MSSTTPVALVFWMVFALGPIPLWHLLLHSFLPFWRRSPRAFYGAAGVLWGLFLPFSHRLAGWSSAIFVPSDGVKLVCLGVGIASSLVALWSIKTLTPRRFFVWAVLRPGDRPPELIRRGPYRFVAHPTYLAMIAAVAASFLASGEIALLGTFVAMGLLLARVIVLEQRELTSRLKASLARASDGRALAPLAVGTDKGE